MHTELLDTHLNKPKDFEKLKVKLFCLIEGTLTQRGHKIYNPKPYKEKYKWQVNKENHLFELPKAQIWCESVHLQTPLRLEFKLLMFFVGFDLYALSV